MKARGRDRAPRPDDFPEAVFGSARSDRRPRLITPVYGGLRSAFSGSTWYLTQAALREGAIDGAFTLNVKSHFNPRLQAAGAAWKFGRAMRGKRHGGFKFAQAFQDILWSQHAEAVQGCVVINNTQLYGPGFLARYAALDIVPILYIDGTLAEYFYNYGQHEDQTIGRDIVKRAIDMERRSYECAPLILTMSQSTQSNLAEVYGIDPAKVQLLIPGANFDDATVPPLLERDGWSGPEFTLGFVGLFPKRKGLDVLAEAMRILRDRGLPVRLKVIGRCPDEIAAMDGVTFLGTIDKLMDAPRFLREIRGCDLGCQLSRAELLGIAMLEFLRVGVPVLATAVGGMPDVLAGGEEDGGLLVPSDVQAEVLAETIQSLMEDGRRFAALRAAAGRRAEWASWRRTAQELDRALAPFG